MGKDLRSSLKIIGRYAMFAAFIGLVVATIFAPSFLKEETNYILLGVCVVLVVRIGLKMRERKR